MEKILNITFNRGGSGSYTPRVSLPMKWVKKMGISLDNKEIKLKFDGEKIIIEKK